MPKKHGTTAEQQADLSALNADPTAKGRSNYEAERARIARATIELELEQIDGTPQRMKLFKRQTADGPCMCDSCTKRRLWIAVRRVDKKQEELELLDALDDLVAKAYQGELDAVVHGLKTYGINAVFHLGGPIAVAGCGECKHNPPADPCYHCGRAGWMRSRKDLMVSRKDLKAMPTYLIMPLLTAAAWGGHILLVKKLLKMGCPVDLVDDMGCTALHWCACQGHKNLKRQMLYQAIAEELLKANADVTLMDTSTKLPVELTNTPNPPFPTMKMTILKHSQENLNKCLLAFCQQGDIAMSRRSIAAGADMGCGDWLNDTPLHIAITYGHKELIDMLVDTAMVQHRLKELVYAKTVDGLNCFDVAKKWGFKTVAIMLQAYVEQARITEKVNDLMKGGSRSIPLHLKGTMLGQKMEQEIKRQKTVQARTTKMLRARQKTALKEERKEATRLGIPVSELPAKSKACVVS
eukprot:CAMPEP_0179455610 /NCGR_PEP_ID=MMETSP0799-20121207/39528_1 /TAXON_ID=46947 /ORGANISM="Geminigera cryophila, Strain CCMP2564" /LENGTH=465 /DNA_ID=CAMNT_0021254769 /DNA_START=32 /DNA_END=1429 /DNA_ORIENTATION=+